MMFGKQYRYCPNCGRRHYDQNINMTHVPSMCCDAECRAQWQSKYAMVILGRDAEAEKEGPCLLKK